MTTVYWHPDGELSVPFSAVYQGFIGCGYERIAPDHCDFEEWQQAIERGLADVVDDDATTEKAELAVEPGGGGADGTR